MVAIVHKRPDGKIGVIHAGKFVKQTFETEAEAEYWMDCNIDDQMFDGPNWFSPPLEYEP